MKKWLRKRPWIWLVILYAVFLAGWVSLITIAVNNRPETVELKTESPAHQ